MGEHSVFAVFVFLITFRHFFGAYSLQFHEKLLLSKSVVEQARRILCRRSSDNVA